MTGLALLRTFIGIAGILLIARLCGPPRGQADWRPPLIALAGMVLLSALLLASPGTRAMLAGAGQVVNLLQEASEAGSSFVFGYLGGAQVPWPEDRPGASFVLAFRALPVLIVLAALMRLLTWCGLLPLLVRGVAWLLIRVPGVSGPVGLCAAANVFLGMVEAPLLVRPWLNALDRSELFLLMSTGMATIAGTVFVLYASLLAPVLPDAAGHLLVASLLNVPAAIAIGLLMVPPVTRHRASLPPMTPEESSGPLDAIARGAEDGLQMALRIVAMLIAAVALVHLANSLIGELEAGGEPLSLQRLLGWLLAPLAWLIGLPWRDCAQGGALLGLKLVLNELIAYAELAALPPDALTPASRLRLSYALCGFANLGSLAILIAGLSSLAPARRPEVIALGSRSVVAGTLASCLTATVAGAWLA